MPVNGRQSRVLAQSFRCRILIADDEVDCISGLERRLRRHGYIVLASVSELQRLFDAVRRQHPDVVLLDIFFRKEKQNALAHLRKLRRACAQTRFIAHTGIDDPALVTLAMANGASGFLNKFDHEELFAAIEAVLIGEAYIAAGMRGFVPGVYQPPRKAGLTPEQERLLDQLKSKRKHSSIAADLHLPQRTFERRVNELANALGLAQRNTYHIDWPAVRYSPSPPDTPNSD